jgi:hypothetical protein
MSVKGLLSYYLTFFVSYSIHSGAVKIMERPTRAVTSFLLLLLLLPTFEKEKAFYDRHYDYSRHTKFGISLSQRELNEWTMAAMKWKKKKKYLLGVIAA